MTETALAEVDFAATLRKVSTQIADGRQANPKIVSIAQGDYDAFKVRSAYLETMLAAQKAIIKQMAGRLAALEDASASHKSMIYRGVHADGEQYDVGNTCTFGGSLWHCNEATKSRPGDGSAAWTLAVKRGRDGKDMTR